MAIIQKVGLEGVRFFAFHGFYEEEHLTGNEYIIDVITEFTVSGSGDDELSNTVNYERLYEIAADEMSRPRKLLETVAHGILNKIQQEFSFVNTIDISIRKLHLPMKGEVKNSLVQLIFRG
ncbi:dihydroneopterin aldolase [Desertivirga xinjiangensis]|uniref:dihydroneopterin aldolase n=1 Tax=Desertivirga xinjiangensis TaxID=539206 RepID=UPI00210BBBEA|nr:dihydroneopterin aldolase [Pedobacter xinjiangensis]